MKLGVVNKSTTVNRFVLHTLRRNITHLAVITRKTNIKFGFLKGGGGGTGKEPRFALLVKMSSICNSKNINCSNKAVCYRLIQT